MYKKTLLRMLSYVKRYKGSFAVSLLCAFFSVVFSLFIPRLTGMAVDCIVSEGRVDFASLAPILCFILISAVLVFLSQYLMGRFNNRLTYNVASDLRKEAFLHLHTLPIAYFDTHKRGDLVSRVTSDIEALSDGLLLGFTQFFSGVITIAGTIFFLFSVNPIIALAVILVTPLSLFVAAFIASRTSKFFKEQSELRGRQTAFTDEMFTSADEVRSYFMEEESLKAFDELNETWAKSSLRATFYSSITNPSTRFVNSAVYALVALIGGFFALSGRITVGALSSALSYANQYTKPFNEISGVVTELQNAVVCASRVFELIDEKSEARSPEEKLEVKEGAVSFSHVDFSYSKDKPLIEDFTLEASGGKHVAIVGPTGAGKTTIINLLMRFYDVDSGALLIDGKDIRDVSRASLRSSFGMVLQDTYLFTGTIRDNIVLGRGLDDQEVEKAAHAAHADGFIKRLPSGYDTLVSDEGSALSAGERQLLCIARIMAVLPDILILDEATSSIDTRTEALIQNSFATLMKGRTSFIVAHRLSTIENADLILVLKDGHVIETGSHKELLEKKGFYADLFYSQFAV